MSEIPEVTSAMLTDSKLTAMLNKYPDAIDSIHFSDQYTVSEIKEILALEVKLADVVRSSSMKADRSQNKYIFT